MKGIILGAIGSMALGVAAVILAAGGAFSPSSSDAATGTNDPTPGEVFQVSVDMDTTGNPDGSGGLLSALDSSATVPVGNTRLVDIIVDEVDPSNGMANFSFNLKYDPNVVNIVSKAFNSFMLPGGFEIIAAPIPDDSGNWRMDVGQIGAAVTGEGVAVRIGLKCLTDGVSQVDLADDAGGDAVPDILDTLGVPLTVQTSVDGVIICGEGAQETPTPSPTPDGATGTPTPTQTEPGTPTPTPTTTQAPTPTPQPTATATTAPTATAGVSESPTATPAALPPTGGVDEGSGLPWTWLVAALSFLLCSLGVAAFTRGRRATSIQR